MPSPLSERAVWTACLGFALWTLCAHAVVLAGGSLTTLMALFVAVGVACVFVARRLPAAEEPAEPPAEAPPARETPVWLRPAAAGAACSAAAIALAVDVPIATWALWMVVLAAGAVVFVLRDPARLEAPEGSRLSEASLLVLGGLCALYALGVHRPDADDSFYVNMAVAAIDHPELPLLARETVHGRFDLPIFYAAYRLHSWELWNAAWARLSGLPAVAIFHLIAAPVAAFAVPLAHAALFRRLVPGAWIFACFALVWVVMLPGETHRWYGNFGLVRIWQGKSVFLFVFLPLVYAAALDFAARGGERSWWRLAAAQVAGVGCTASALWVAPVAALVGMSCVLRPRADDLRRLGVGALTCAYPIAAGLLIRGDMTDAMPELARTFAPGRLFDGALETALGDARLHVVGVFAVFAAWALGPAGLARRFAIVAPLAVGLVLLNPWLDAFVRNHVSGPYYWRVMWALPVPVLLALLAVAPLSLRIGTPRTRAVAWLAGLVVFALAIPTYPSFDSRNEGARLAWPGLKLPENHRWARALSEAAPRGRVVAPPVVSAWVPVDHDHAYPMMVRVYLDPLRERIGKLAHRDRALMTHFVDGVADHPRAAAIFERGLELYDVRAVCLRNGATLAEARRILRAGGFTKRMQGSDLEIWVRDDAEA